MQMLIEMELPVNAYQDGLMMVLITLYVSNVYTLVKLVLGVLQVVSHVKIPQIEFLIQIAPAKLDFTKMELIVQVNYFYY